jgi:chromate transport protein ChrA
MTILSGSIIKIAICIGILFYHGIFEMMILSSLAVIMIVSAVIEFIVVYRNRLSSTIMSKFLVYTAVVIFGISSYFDSYYLLLWAYLLVLLLYCLFNTGNILRKEKSETTIRVNYTIANS